MSIDRQSRLLTIYFVLQIFISTVNSQAEVWLSTGDSRTKLVRQRDIGGSGPVGGKTIDVDRNRQFQDIKGFGAALSNSAAYLLHKSPDREAILNDLFNTKTGIGLSYIRLVMGGSDFNAVSPYTYDDTKYENFNMDQFSIAKDRDFVIPVLRDIIRINPEVRIMASPWSAPAWMKNSRTLYGGTIRSESQYLASYAEYFVRFIRHYQAEGIRIDTVTLQNEPQYSTGGYPTMLMPWEVQRDFIRYHVGPRFRQEGFSTQIIIWDHNWDGSWYPMNVLRDPEANQYIGGTAWHCYGGKRYDPVAVNNAYPNKDMYFTECSGTKQDAHFGSVLGWNTQNLFIGQTRIGSRTVLLWNLALDENHGPRVDVRGCTDCRGVVTIPSWGGHEKNVEYYALGHFAKFVRPGARRIWSATYEAEELESVAYQNPDNSVVVVVANVAWGATTKTFQVLIDGVYYYYQNLPSRSVITLIKR